MKAREQEAGEGFIPFLPLLRRLDRLESLIELLVERRCLPAKNHSGLAQKMAIEDRCKTISSALEEVQCKGSIAERLLTLEKRVFQLGLELDARTSTSASSRDLLPQGVEHESNQSPNTQQELNQGSSSKNKSYPLSTQGIEIAQKQQDCVEGRRWKRQPQIARYRNWIGCLEAKV